jgi:hypothetical protein
VQRSNDAVAEPKFPFLFKRHRQPHRARVRQKIVLFESVFLDGSFN